MISCYIEYSEANNQLLSKQYANLLLEIGDKIIKH